jgi:hypothetical protein
MITVLYRLAGSYFRNPNAIPVGKSLPGWSPAAPDGKIELPG